MLCLPRAAFCLAGVGASHSHKPLAQETEYSMLPGDELGLSSFQPGNLLSPSRLKNPRVQDTTHSGSDRCDATAPSRDGGKLRDLGNFAAALDWCAWKNVPSSFHPKPPPMTSGPCEKGDSTSLIRLGAARLAHSGVHSSQSAPTASKEKRNRRRSWSRRCFLRQPSFCGDIGLEDRNPACAIREGRHIL
jgi:hypothetical protein